MCGSEIDIVQETTASSYCTREIGQIVLYKKDQPDCIVHGLWCEEGKRKKRGSPMHLRSKVKSEHNKQAIVVTMVSVDFEVSSVNT